MIKLDLKVIYSEKMRMNISMMNLSFNSNSKVNTIPDVLIDFFLNHMSITEENKDVSCLLFARVPSGLLYVVDVFEETEEGWNFKFQASEQKPGAESEFVIFEKGMSGLKTLLKNISDYFTFWVYVTDQFMDALEKESKPLYTFVQKRLLDFEVETRNDDSTLELLHSADINHTCGALYAVGCAAAA